MKCTEVTFYLWFHQFSFLSCQNPLPCYILLTQILVTSSFYPHVRLLQVSCYSKQSLKTLQQIFEHLHNELKYTNRGYNWIHCYIINSPTEQVLQRPKYKNNLLLTLSHHYTSHPSYYSFQIFVKYCKAV